MECWTHNTILQKNYQLEILTKTNFNKFVKALLTLSKPTATIRFFDEQEVQTVSPYSSSPEEEDSEDDDDDDEDQSHATTTRSSFDASELDTDLPFLSSSDEEESEDDENFDGDEDDLCANATMNRLKHCGPLSINRKSRLTLII